MDHRVHTANHVRGLMSIPFGKCLCGAYLEGQQAIDEHKELEGEHGQARPA